MIALVVVREEPINRILCVCDESCYCKGKEGDKESKKELHDGRHLHPSVKAKALDPASHYRRPLNFCSPTTNVRLSMSRPSPFMAEISLTSRCQVINSYPAQPSIASLRLAASTSEPARYFTVNRTDAKMPVNITVTKRYAGWVPRFVEYRRGKRYLVAGVASTHSFAQCHAFTIDNDASMIYAHTHTHTHTLTLTLTHTSLHTCTQGDQESENRHRHVGAQPHQCKFPQAGQGLPCCGHLITATFQTPGAQCRGCRPIHGKFIHV